MRRKSKPRQGLDSVWLLSLIGACRESIDWARGRPVSAETLAAADSGWREWLENKLDGNGYGYGYGYGNGNGSGYGYGYGSGYGDGDGDGSGYGDGRGEWLALDVVSITNGDATLTGDVAAQALAYIGERVKAGEP